jgi:hypothetical protein
MIFPSVLYAKWYKSIKNSHYLYQLHRIHYLLDDYVNYTLFNNTM